MRNTLIYTPPRKRKTRIDYEKLDSSISPEALRDMKDPYHPESISYNYSMPTQTDINEWSVFVRKFLGMKECMGVIQHRFDNELSAEEFSKNNWNLGDYF